jgi:hypothetical protein
VGGCPRSGTRLPYFELISAKLGWFRTPVLIYLFLFSEYMGRQYPRYIFNKIKSSEELGWDIEEMSSACRHRFPVFAGTDDLQPSIYVELEQPARTMLTHQNIYTTQCNAVHTYVRTCDRSSTLASLLCITDNQQRFSNRSAANSYRITNGEKRGLPNIAVGWRIR